MESDDLTNAEMAELAEALSSILAAIPAQGTGRDQRARDFLADQINAFRGEL